MAQVSHFMSGSDWTNPEQTPPVPQGPPPGPPPASPANLGAPPAGTTPLPPAAAGALDDSGNARVQALQGPPPSPSPGRMGPPKKFRTAKRFAKGRKLFNG